MAFEINNEKSASNVSKNKSLKKTYLSYKYSYNNFINLYINTYLKWLKLQSIILKYYNKIYKKNDLIERIHKNTRYSGSQK